MDKKIILIFTRDFSQWLNEMLRNFIVLDFPKIWGRGLHDQIVHFNGRACEWWRYEDDYNELAEYMTHKSLGDYIWQEDTHVKFRAGIKKFREIISTDPAGIRDAFSFFQEILSLSKFVYPFYTLCVFVPGPWREKFLAVHGDTAESVLKTLMKSRQESEGVFKLLDNWMRAWIGPLISSAGFPVRYFNLLSIGEIEIFLRGGTLPATEVLDARAREYVYIGGEIIPVSNFDDFVRNRGIIYDKSAVAGEVRGTVACRGGLIRGTVQVIYNTAEAASFKNGNILVTPMTSPEYLSAMKQALAVVTDEGGLTCHAAIVSRELGIPCVIGTKIATKVFKDGDMVEVDAVHGVIRKIL